MPEPPKIPRNRTTCKVCREHPEAGEFTLQTPAVPIIGEDPAKQIGIYIETLTKHLAKKHPQVLKDLNERAKAYMLFLGFSFFESDEPKIIDTWNAIRHAIRKQAERYTFEDAAIEAKVQKLNLPAADQDAVVSLMLDMRDLLLEQGRYALPGLHTAETSRLSPSVPA
jgi:hypothetical protein